MQSLRRIRRPVGRAVIALALPLLAGCGGGGGGSSSGGSPGTPVPKPLTAKTPGGLTASLAEDKGAVAAGGTVTYTLSLVNSTAATVVIHTTSATAPPALLAVRDPAGNLVYNPMPPPPLTDVSLAPGKALTEMIPIAVFTTKGTYKATASFSFSDGTVATPVGPLSITVQ